MNINFNAEKPREEDNVVCHFVTSKLEDFEECLCDSKGKVIEKRIVKKPFTEVVPPSAFENKDLPCSLFSVEVQQAAGIDLFKKQPLGVKLYGSDLDTRSEVAEQLDKFDYEQLTEQDFNE